MAPGYNTIYKCTSRDCIENNLHFLRNSLLELAKIFVALQIAVKYLKNRHTEARVLAQCEATEERSSDASDCIPVCT